MGGSLSKATRKLPRRTEAPSWAGSRTINPTSSKSPQTEIPRVSETKDEGV